MKLFKVKYKDGASVLVLATHVRQDDFINMTRFYQLDKEIFSEFNTYIKTILMTELD